MKTVEWLQGQRRAIHDQLVASEMRAVGSPNHDQLVASAHAYAYGQLHGLLDVLERDGLKPAPGRPMMEFYNKER